MKAAFLLSQNGYDQIYGPEERAEIADLVAVAPALIGKANWPQHAETLGSVEILFSGWGMVPLSAEFLAAVPKLRAVFYGAGSIRNFMTDDAWDRGIIVCSAWKENAVPVAEFTLAQILLATKRAVPFSRAFCGSKRLPRLHDVVGNYGSTIGIISLGMTGRKVREMLQPFHHRVIAYDPFVIDEQASELGVELVGLDQLFDTSDVVSLHTPLLPETVGMITGQHFERMKPGSTFINTARGAIVREDEMIQVLSERSDLFAVLDVTHPEPPAADSPLYTMPNVILTPHIAGSLGRECRRMGRAMVDECRRFLSDQPLLSQVSRELAARMA